MNPIIQAINLQKSYGGPRVVDGLDLSIKKGECFGLLGPNGAGKTTTLRMLLGLIAPDAGSATLLGLPVPQAAREARIRVGVVPQMDNLDPDFTVVENLLIYGRYFRLPDALINSRIPRLLDFAGLASKGEASIRTLSGGMKRRLNIGASLIHSPRLLLLDEPTVGVDPQSRNLIFEEVRRINAGGVTIVYTSHYMEEVQALCPRIGIMDHGKVIACDTLEGLLTRLESLIKVSCSAP